MSKTLVIVESPTKARTIEKFLGKDFVVRASYGHVRDLPSNAEEIPAAVKKEKWARIGVNVDADFEPLYVVSAKKKQNISELKKLMKDASEVLLATDEDREGESISWHLCEILNPKIPYKRLVFHEITREAIDQALKSPRSIDENLVKAQETRRIIDRLFGYTVSPVLWKKMKPRLSAGRVQSVALRLLVERERERVTFRSAGYWDLKALFSKEGTAEAAGRFEAELAQLKGKRIASGKDFDPKTGRLTDPNAVVLLDAKTCADLREKLLQGQAKVTSVEEKDYSSKPYAPFTTSTLQQEASRKLGFAARRTMQVAQMLYENGLITYMRTDSTNLSDEALRGARTLIEREYGADYMPAQPRLYRTSVKNAQEAHEAIRPAGEAFASMDFVREKFGQEAFRLYELIWKRTVASQMKDSRGKRVSAQIELEDALFRASGTTIEFPGYLRAYVEGSDDPEAELADREKFLPKLKEGETLKTLGLDALEHTTQAPARFTEGSLIKELERLGIGRPSTWATIVDIVLSRDYAFKKGSALVPTFLAMAVIGLMERFFADVVDYAYTAHMEDDLDAISRGEAESLKYLRKFYFGDGSAGLKNLVEAGSADIDPRDVCGLPIGEDENGNKVEVRIGRFGPFLSNGENRASVPDGVCPDEMTVEKAVQMLAQSAKGPSPWGRIPPVECLFTLKMAVLVPTCSSVRCRRAATSLKWQASCRHEF
jgi:DNA topoisomerase-1